jgi:hypothetical protein
VSPRPAAAALAILLLGGCGKYGPPLREAEAARARERAEEREKARAEDEARSKAREAAPTPDAGAPDPGAEAP